MDIHSPVATRAIGAQGMLRHLQDLPCPAGLPWLGNLLQLRPSRLHLQLERWHEELGGSFCFRMGRRPVVVMADAQALQTALRSRPQDFRRGHVIESVFDEIGANGLFSVEGEAWRPQRQLIMQALSPAQMRGFHPLLVDITRGLLRRWQRAAARGAVLEMTQELTRFTVDVTTTLAFGENPDTIASEGDVIQQQLALVFPMIQRRVNAPFPWWRLFKLPGDRRFDAALARVHDHIDGLIARARERLRNSRGQPRNLLENLLLQAAAPGSSIRDADVRANVLTVLLAGEDTTANMLAWTLHQLASQPRWQDRLHAQAVRVLGPSDVCEGLADLERLDLFEACATEASRLRPTVPIFYLETLREVTLAGVSLPARTQLLMLTRPAMLEKRNFADPYRFRPQRWLRPPACPVGGHRELAALLPHEPRAHVQFGAGPRVCPGRHLAGQEIRLVLSMLMRHFRIEHAGPPDAVAERNVFTMMPSRLPMRLVPRGLEAS
ncbi:MAG: cytochrome P450 [Pelomonas sp.]|nr:cytochrome P450 [Roseateles sp.]